MFCIILNNYINSAYRQTILVTLKLFLLGVTKKYKKMPESKILEKLNLPEDLKKLSLNELESLCEEIRKKIIDVVSKNGGHLASNLGVIELTVALYTVFNFKVDDIVWDVGHQCYTHKILSGRLDKIETIRKKDGISGFPKINESVFDSFGTGHSSTSISAALGISEAKYLLNKENYSRTIAVLGDGALTGGLSYEGLNNAGNLNRNFIVILNDNEMSISKNVGAIARYLSSIRIKNLYLKTKGILSWSLGHVPIIGSVLKKSLIYSKSALKKFLYGTIFENMGFLYYFVADGHNLKDLINALNVVKDINRPVLLHVKTTKGKGYIFAEQKPQKFHGVSKFSIDTGINKNIKNKDTFSSIFGKTLCDIAKNNKKVCAITAAMEYGTGLTEFSKKFSDRFFDVGIAEEHAVTFACGLASKGIIPVFAVYSSFLQRSYDQLIHDAALQNLKIIIAIDRAGIVGEDGETHQGIFDVPFLNTIPNVTVYSPSYFLELKLTLNNAINYGEGVIAIRYPKGSEKLKPDFLKLNIDYNFIDSNEPSHTLIVTYGKVFSNALLAKKILKDMGINVCILKLNKIKPINKQALELSSNFENIFFFEEGVLSGGTGEKFYYEFSKYNKLKSKFKLVGINNEFIKQDTVDSTLKKLKLDPDGIADLIAKTF